MKAKCIASALIIRSLPVPGVSTDTGRRMIFGQVADVHGKSIGNDDWWYVDAPAGRGWCSRRYLTPFPTGNDTDWIPNPAWPAVPSGRVAIESLFGRPGNPLCSSGRAVLPKPLKIGWLDSSIMRFSCHKVLEDVFTSVFAEIHRRGLWDELETFDGCYNDRTVTRSQKVSTHAWGASVDLNAATNRLGARPTMNQKIVAIFKDHGFTWGGDWSRPDGMHFQYVRGY